MGTAERPTVTGPPLVGLWLSGIENLWTSSQKSSPRPARPHPCQKRFT